MRVAVLADIHGNAPALDAVLRDVDRASPDVIVLNGDIADGQMPRETLERLLDLGDRAIWVGGNTDRWLVDAFDRTLPLPGHNSAVPRGTPKSKSPVNIDLQQDHRTPANVHER